MPSGNQGQGRRNDGGHERNKNGGPEPKNPPQAVEEAAGRLREGYETARDEVSQRYRHAEKSIARNPGSSVMLGFGLGLGFGLALTALLTRREETWAERYVPESLRDLPGTVRNAHVPESVHHTYHHLAETLRDLPSSIARAIGR